MSGPTSARPLPRPAPRRVRSSLVQRCGGHPCPPGGCRHGDGRLARAGGRGPAVAPPAVHQVLREPGRPLDRVVRAEMEARLGHDFAAVRVHADARAADSARAVNASAYTVGRHVVLAAGADRPRSEQGRRLLAHELTHVVQQSAAAVTGAPLRVSDPADAAEREADDVAAGSEPAPPHPAAPAVHGAPMLARAWEACGPPELCPRREPGERQRGRPGRLQVGAIAAPEPGLLVSGFGIGSGDASTLELDPAWAPFRDALAAGDDRWEIVGFSDCEGPPQRNSPLRMTRAMAVFNLLPERGRDRIDRLSAAPLEECVAPNATERDRTDNRSVVFRRTVTFVEFPPEPVEGRPACTPAPGLPSGTCDIYVDNAWWLPLAYANNATCACETTPDDPTASCVRKFLQDRLAAYPQRVKLLAAARKPEEFLNPVDYQAFVQTTLTPRIYQDHVDAYKSCCCPCGPAPYPAWMGVTTVPIRPCSLVGEAIRQFGPCHCTPGRW
jgi:hypothetical protein